MKLVTSDVFHLKENIHIEPVSSICISSIMLLVISDLSAQFLRTDFYLQVPRDEKWLTNSSHLVCVLRHQKGKAQNIQRTVCPVESAVCGHLSGHFI